MKKTVVLLKQLKVEQYNIKCIDRIASYDYKILITTCKKVLL